MRSDNHFQSFHSTDPDGHSAAKELEMAKDKIGLWYKTFPYVLKKNISEDLHPYL